MNRPKRPWYQKDKQGFYQIFEYWYIFYSSFLSKPWNFRQTPWLLQSQPSNNTAFLLYTEIVASGLELYVIHKPKAITTASTEDDIEIPTQFHYLISLWLAMSALQDQRKFNEAAVIEQKYDIWVIEMITFVKERYNQPKEKTISWLNDFR